jgi:hypothetical protein
MVCNGDGSCLIQSDINEYTRRCCLVDPMCVPVRFPNYLICDTTLPLWVLHCHRGTCMNCAIEYGRRLVFYHPEISKRPMCPVCLEEQDCFVLHHCSHGICVPCMRRDGWILESPQAEDFGFAPPDDWEGDEDDDTFNAWAAAEPESYQDYRNALDRQQEERESTATRFSSKVIKQCPVCRDDRGLVADDTDSPPVPDPSALI